MLKALLWDVDGTLAETERDGHRVAFNRAFEEVGVPWRWDERHYGELLRVTGGRERLLHDMHRQVGAPASARERTGLAATLHRLKNEHYLRIVHGGDVQLRPGVVELLADCSRAGLQLGIVTTTSRCNVDALLEYHLGKEWNERFAAVVCAEQAPNKKPDPQAYLMALEALRLRPSEAIAIEDSPAGFEAGQRAGLPVVVTHSYYFPAFPSSGALAVGSSLAHSDGWQPRPEPRRSRIDLDQIIRWHERSSGTLPERSALAR